MFLSCLKVPFQFCEDSKLTLFIFCSGTNEPAASGRKPPVIRANRRLTVPIHKNPQKGSVPSNHQPITCLSTTRKLLSGSILAKTSRCMAQYMSGAQKGAGRSTRGILPVAGRGWTKATPTLMRFRLKTRRFLSRPHVPGYF